MNNTSTIPDSLYDKAFAYFNTELYKTLFDSDIFAVRFTDGEIGYCCVMGMLGEYISLAVYPGKSGLYSFYGINSLGDENISEQEYKEFKAYTFTKLALMYSNAIFNGFQSGWRP